MLNTIMNEVLCEKTSSMFACCTLDNGEDFLAIARAIPDPMFIIADDGLVLDVLGGNTPDIYGAMGTLKGRRLADFLPAEVACHYLAIIRDCLNGGGLQTFEFRLSPDALLDPGTSRSGQGAQWFEARIQPLPKRADRPDAVVWTAFNITERKLLIDKLSALCARDALTGLYNRRHFVSVLEKQFDISRRYGQDMSLLIMDLDNFKRINDTFGHAAGDTALKGFAANCNRMFRKADIFARFGGEEFVALLPNTDLKGAHTLAERLRVAVEQHVVDIGGLGIEMTVSIGVTAQRPEDDTVDEIMSRADQALYRAKDLGRNQVCLYSDSEFPAC